VSRGGFSPATGARDAGEILVGSTGGSTWGRTRPQPPVVGSTRSHPCRSHVHAPNVIGGFSRTRASAIGKRRVREWSVVGLDTGERIERGTPVVPTTIAD
jgi:hypothetical protein